MRLNWAALDLWPNQREALKRCTEYLATPKQAALIQMPTGTGKTGVIAVLSRVESKTSTVLVVSPSKGLAAQLRIDIADAFWSKIAAPAEWRPTHVRTLLPSTCEENANLLRTTSGAGVVLVGTLVSLLEIATEYPTAYGELKRHVGIVIVDEGHREPAEQWANAVRNLRKPTILFSATPYRNDLRQFDVSNDWIHFLSFQASLEQHLIRDVDFESLGSNGTAKGFARELVKCYDRHLRSGRLHKNCRVIVRCASETSVRSMFHALTSELEDRPEKCLALHDAFASESPPLFSSVPNIRERGETFLVHQYKLTEGIDDPRCMLLAVFEDFDNERQLVQQVGRILRHPSPLKGATADALVVSDRVTDIEARWNAYRLFDKVCEESGGKPPIRNSLDTLLRMLQAYPAADYYGGKFRKVVDFAAGNISDEVQVPQSCILYRIRSATSGKPIESRIRELLQEEDRTIVHSSKSHKGRCLVLLSLVLSESPFLNRSLFPVLGLEVTVAVTSGSYLFFYDSGRLSIDDVIDGTRLEIGEIMGLFPESEKGKITSISVLNGDIGPSAVRSRTIGAASLADAVPFMGDNAYFVSRATGRLDGGRRRYLGFTRARVRDNEGEYAPLEDFVSWGDSLVKSLESNPTPASFFDRFASPVSEPKNTAPKNILLEAATIEHGFVDRAGKTLEVTDACAEVLPDHTCPDQKFKHAFTVSINQALHTVWIRWDPDRRRYTLLSPQLDDYHEIGKPKATLTGRLNLTQEFRIIPASTRVLYAAGQFYDFKFRFGNGSPGTLLLDVLFDVAELDHISTEKGVRPKGVAHADWSQDSLFNFIDKGMAASAGPFGMQFSHIVCDDMGTESGDFIGINRNAGVVVFAQAKCRRDAAQVAASALYDVCAQGNKNLGYLRYGGLELPGRARKWMQAWKGGTKKLTYTVKPRIRRGPAIARTFLDEMNEMLAKPGTRREMWLVLGRTLSKSEFRRELASHTPPASTIQTFYLLMTVHSACKSVGVELRIFCSP